MQNPVADIQRTKRTHYRQSRSRLVAALGITGFLHALLLFIPIGERRTPSQAARSIEVELLAAPVVKTTMPETVVVQAAPPESTTQVSSTIEVPPEMVKLPVEMPAETATTPAAQSSPRHLASRLLSAPYEDETLSADPFAVLPTSPAYISDFHYPEQENMLVMLRQPLPDLPFEDPGLNIFMYAPGVMGDFHRGFDKITPEFGYTSNTGFKIRCKWVLIIVACGWGR